MCSLKKSKWIEARNLCDKVLEENPDVAKAYFRRGEALFNLNDHELGMNYWKEFRISGEFFFGIPNRAHYLVKLKSNA